MNYEGFDLSGLSRFHRNCDGQRKIKKNKKEKKSGIEEEEFSLS